MDDYNLEDALKDIDEGFPNGTDNIKEFLNWVVRQAMYARLLTEFLAVLEEDVISLNDRIVWALKEHGVEQVLEEMNLDE